MAEHCVSPVIRRQIPTALEGCITTPGSCRQPVCIKIHITHTYYMNNVAVANSVGALSALLTLAGITGVTSADVSGFVTVLGALISFIAFIWSHIAHKSALAAAKQ